MHIDIPDAAVEVIQPDCIVLSLLIDSFHKQFVAPIDLLVPNLPQSLPIVYSDDLPLFKVDVVDL
jgi:hypothetical protein